MKKYQYWSIDTLTGTKDRLKSDIAAWERILANTKSYLIQLSLTHSIKKANEEIRAIDAELCYREHHTKSEIV